MKTSRKWILGAGGAVLAVAGAAALLRPAQVIVDAAHVVRGPLVVTVDEEGETRVRDRYVVATPVGGRVARITLREGGRRAGGRGDGDPPSVGSGGRRDAGPMTDWLASLSPVMQGTLAGVGTWLLTALGSVPVLFMRDAPRRLMDVLMGFAAGIMVAASSWSLLVPALERGGVAPAVTGLLAGAAVLYVLDQTLPHLHPEFPDEATREGPPSPWRRTTLLITAITLHNFPEGLAVGVGFGGTGGAAAMALAIGIGLQNLPEGLAVALPLRREGMNRWKALWYGQLTAVVEPVAALLGAAVVSQVAAVLPFAMAFAAGAMLYVVVEELIPETVRTGNIDVATIGFIAGFAVMMALDNLVG